MYPVLSDLVCRRKVASRLLPPHGSLVPAQVTRTRTLSASLTANLQAVQPANKERLAVLMLWKATCQLRGSRLDPCVIIREKKIQGAPAAGLHSAKVKKAPKSMHGFPAAHSLAPPKGGLVGVKEVKEVLWAAHPDLPPPKNPRHPLKEPTVGAPRPPQISSRWWQLARCWIKTRGQGRLISF